jgi:hypothetical protein
LATSLLGKGTTTEEEGTTLEEITPIVSLPIEGIIVEGKTLATSLLEKEDNQQQVWLQKKKH